MSIHHIKNNGSNFADPITVKQLLNQFLNQ